MTNAIPGLLTVLIGPTSRRHVYFITSVVNDVVCCTTNYSQRNQSFHLISFRKDELLTDIFVQCQKVG